MRFCSTPQRDLRCCIIQVILTGDVDYEDMMSEPYRFSEFTDYLAEPDGAAASSLENVEDASFVRLPKPRNVDSSWLGGDVGGDDNDVL